jgi:hypothetical protein
MLDTGFFDAAARALAPSGKLTIVSDNVRAHSTSDARRHATRPCVVPLRGMPATVRFDVAYLDGVRVSSAGCEWQAWYAESLLQLLGSHGAWCGVAGALPADGAGFVRREGARGLVLVSGAPGAWCGHATPSSSYFDRLWRRGANRHSKREERFVLHAQRL